MIMRTMNRIQPTGGLVSLATGDHFIKRVINGQNIELHIKHTPFEQGDFWTETIYEKAELVGYQHVNPEIEVSAETASYVNDLNDVEFMDMLPELEPCE
jgi:hypothetical protein